MGLCSEDLDNIRSLLKAELAEFDTKLKAEMADNNRLLKAEMADNNRLLNTKLDKIDKRLGRLETGKVAPEADRLAKLITVAISDEENPPDGHGLLFALGKIQYLLSAAHVVVNFESERCVKLQWGGSSEGKTIVRARVKKLYLDKRYIEKGTFDIGLVEVEIIDQGKEIEELFAKVPVELPQESIELGDFVTGHGLVFLCGQLVHVDGESNRLMCQTISAPGCSGCPLFDSTKKLLAVVHGNSKHRHNSSAVEDASHSVFADFANLKDYKFQLVNEDKKDLLRRAEELPEEVAEMSGEKVYLLSPDCPLFILHFALRMGSKVLDDGCPTSELHEEQFCWDDLMVKLAKHALSDTFVSIEGNTLSCLAPKLNVASASSSMQGVTSTAMITPTKS